MSIQPKTLQCDNLTFTHGLPSDEIDVIKGIVFSTDIESYEQNKILSCLLDENGYEAYKTWRVLYDSQRIESLKNELVSMAPKALKAPCKKLLSESKFKSVKVIFEDHRVANNALNVLSELEQLVNSSTNLDNESNETSDTDQEDTDSEFLSAKMDHSQNGSETDSDAENSDGLVIDDGDVSAVTEQLIGFPDQMNVLLLGETGAGKSTTINALANYLKYVNVDDAVNDATVLIRSSFTYTGMGNKVISSRISAEPTVVVEDYEDDESLNEDLRAGESSTQKPKSYLFTWTNGDKKKLLRIIDTPGIGDVRGIELDRKNIEMILDLIRHVPKLHGICILIRPNAPRLTAELRFSIDELLVHLHKSAAQNIMICLTGTRHTFYGPGETYATLSEHFAKIQTDFDRNVPLDKNNLFCFENEGFRYICGVNSGYPFPEDQEQLYSESYTHSAIEAWRMFSEIGSLQPHSVSNTLVLNNARRYIRIISAEIAMNSKDLNMHKDLLEEKKNEIDKVRKEIRVLKKGLDSTMEVIVRVPTSRPKTVCANEKCIERKRFHPSTPLEPYYKTVCDPNCPLTNVPRETFPSAALQKCTAMGFDLKCKICGCSWQTHMHIYYDLVKQMQKVEKSDIVKALKEKDDELVSLKNDVEKLEQEVTELTDKSSKARGHCKKLARFVKENSIIPYNGSYIQYLEYMFSHERSKAAITKDYAKVRELERLKAEYQELISIFDQINLNEEELLDANGLLEFLELLRKEYEDGNEEKKEVLELLHLKDEGELKSIVVPMGDVEF